MSCNGDPELRNEVESLLASSDKDVEFLRESVQESDHDLIQTDRGAISSEAIFGHYQIISRLGSGGMGEVYLARDMQLKRRVAIKVLAPELTHNTDALRRFEQEAQTVSALNHPNILTIYEFGQSNGHHFIASEFVEGQTVREKLLSGRIDASTAIDVAAQIASALVAAHASGVIHRDIKPDNVMLRADGVTKVLDFGIAKLTEARGKAGGTQSSTVLLGHTQPGTVVGTVKYMSPEQARGVAVDARSDIFSLGAVIYEMVTGRAPFEGETGSDVIAEILKGDPPPLLDLAPDLPPELERIINKAMRKDRESRYQTARDLRNDLRDVAKELDFQTKPQRISDFSSSTSGLARPAEPAITTTPESAAVTSGVRKPSSIRGRILASLAGALIVAAITFGVFSSRRSKIAQPRAAPRSLAILPFRNVRPDPSTDFLGFSLADAVITKLGYVDAFTVRPSSAIEKYRNQAIDPQKVAAELKVDTLLTGSFIKEGSELRINAQLIDVKGNQMLWQDTIDLKYDKLLTVQDRVAQSLIRGLELKLSPGEAARLQHDRPIDNVAYEYYLRGVDFYAANEFTLAIEMLEKSAAIEPNYAPTWAHLGRAYTTNASLHFGGREQYQKAKAAYEKAIALNPALPEPRIYMANLFTDTGRVEQSVPLLRGALESSPNNAEARWELGYAYRFGGMLKESIAECERARQLDPEVKINSSALNSYLYVGEYEKFLDSLPPNDSVYILFYRGFGQYYTGNWEEAEKAFDRAYDLAPSLLQAQVGKALSYGIRHDGPSGIRLLRETERMINERGVSDAEAIYKVAQAYAVLGDKSSALRMLRRSIEGGFFCYSYFRSDPLLAHLRDEAEFRVLLDQAKQRHEQFQARFFGRRPATDE